MKTTITKEKVIHKLHHIWVSSMHETLDTQEKKINFLRDQLIDYMTELKGVNI